MALTRKRTSPNREHSSSPISSRGSPFPGNMLAHGVPESAERPSGLIFSPKDLETRLKALRTYTPEQAEDMITVVSSAIQVALDRFSVFVQSKTFQNWDIQLVALAANVASRLDLNADIVAEHRRAVMFVNPNATNILWVGKSNVVIAGGVPVAAGGGTYQVSIEGARVQHYGIIAANETIPVITFW